MLISVGSVFHTIEECNPTRTTTSIVQPSVLQVSSASSIPLQTPLSIQPVVTSNIAYVIYDGDNTDSDRSIFSCSNAFLANEPNM
jgi:hypothetical protein